MKEYIRESIALQNAVLHDDVLMQILQESSNTINACLNAGNKLLIAGNGGSAADAQHFSAELVGRYKKERKGYPAIALTVDTSILTAWSNDYTYDTIFARQIEALGTKGDVFIGISTSGNSKNLIEGVIEAKKKGMHVMLLLGKDGGILKDMSTLSCIVPSDNTPRIQEVHGMLIHIICEEFEKQLT